MLRPRTSSSPLAPPYPYLYPYLDANRLDQDARAAQHAEHAVDGRIVAEEPGRESLVEAEYAGMAGASADGDEAVTSIDQVKVVEGDKPKVIG